MSDDLQRLARAFRRVAEAAKPAWQQQWQQALAPAVAASLGSQSMMQPLPSDYQTHDLVYRVLDNIARGYEMAAAEEAEL